MEGDTVGLGEVLDLAAAKAQHRPDQADGAAVANRPRRTDAAEAANAGAANDSLEDGLDVVVGVVGHGDRVAVELEAEPLEELIAALPPSQLDRDALAGRPRADIGGLHRAGHLQVASLLGDELGVGVRVAVPQPVVHMGHVQGGRPALALAQAAQHGEQGHGVDAPGDRHDQRLFAGQQAAFHQGLHAAGFEFIGHQVGSG